MVNFGTSFVKRSTEENATATIDDVIGTFYFGIVFSVHLFVTTIPFSVAHLDHIKNVTGSSQFVGIGADYDGLTSYANYI